MSGNGRQDGLLLSRKEKLVLRKQHV